MMIDPPNGWKYGFPMKFDMEKDGNLNEWLVSKGYPQSMVDIFDGIVPCRYWSEEDE